MFDKLVITFYSYIPKSIFPVLISWVSWSLEIKKQLYKQVNKTKLALLDSFKDENIYFLKNIAINKNVSLLGLRNEHEWMYDTSKNLFVKNGSETNTHKCPWLSAELVCNELVVGDITEWLEGLRFQSKKDEYPSFSCLVQSWAVINGHIITSLKDYKVKVLNELMEEEIFRLDA